MLSLKDFKEFEIINNREITGGEATSHSSGSSDHIGYNDFDGFYMTIGNTFAGCECNNGGSTMSFAIPCCPDEE